MNASNSLPDKHVHYVEQLNMSNKLSFLRFFWYSWHMWLGKSHMPFLSKGRRKEIIAFRQNRNERQYRTKASLLDY